MSYGRLDFAEQWGRMNDTIMALVDYIPADKVNWSPREDLWNFRGILAHIIMVRHNWLGNVVRDGDDYDVAGVLARLGTPDEVKEALKESWERVERFLSDQTKLDAMHEGHGGPDDLLSGHWVAYHLLEHDLHHRSDIFHYLALLEIEHPEIGTP